MSCLLHVLGGGEAADISALADLLANNEKQHREDGPLLYPGKEVTPECFLLPSSHNGAYYGRDGPWACKAS